MRRSPQTYFPGSAGKGTVRRLSGPGPRLSASLGRRQGLRPQREGEGPGAVPEGSAGAGLGRPARRSGGGAGRSGRLAGSRGHRAPLAPAGESSGVGRGGGDPGARAARPGPGAGGRVPDGPPGCVREGSVPGARQARPVGADKAERGRPATTRAAGRVGTGERTEGSRVMARTPGEAVLTALGSGRPGGPFGAPGRVRSSFLLRAN